MKKISLSILEQIRYLWLVCGIAIVLFAVMELGAVAIFWLRDGGERPVDDRALADCYDDISKAQDYYQEYRRASQTRWIPYVYWRRCPFQGRYIHIDERGLRQTVPSPPAGNDPSSRERRIFVFGGSTVWGTGVDDAQTIPSRLAKRLQDESVAVRVLNFGESGYINTQEMIELLRQVQQGNVPDLAIFYDGVNDVFAAYQQRQAGVPQNESHRRIEFNLSRPEEVGRLRALAFQNSVAQLHSVQLGNILLNKAGLKDSEKPGTLELSEETADHLAEAVGNRYLQNATMITAIAQRYRFKCLFYLQPTAFHKPTTTYEEGACRKMAHLEPLLRKCYTSIRNRMQASDEEILFRDLSRRFHEVQDPLYLDWCHLGVEGNDRIAEQMAEDVRSSLNRSQQPPHHQETK